jgi:hypothetical protein
MGHDADRGRLSGRHTAMWFTPAANAASSIVTRV